jgi:serine/threonine-protein kinase PknG
MTCSQAGCPGEVVDGYCNVCGLAPRVAAGAAAAPLASPAATVATAAGTSRRLRSGAPRDSGRRRLGAGLVEIATVTARDPASAVMDAPTVAEHRRFCSNCDAPVGRSYEGSPGRTEGFCRHCGEPFSFAPRLAAGELVAGQYEIVGCLAHGGLGWIYLARDRNVSDRWVVLKGLLNSDDESAMTAALAERRFLAEVEHPNIVKIHNFVEHEGSGYIVMEYVGGTSLRDILEGRRDASGHIEPLPPAQAIAYLVEILPALGHLHRSGLLFCDFKPSNVIQAEHALKLIDLGGVYRIDDETSPVYGTAGYQAPEIAEAGPSVASDVFTVARTLAVLCTEFRGYQTTYRYTLPPQDSVELFARHDSLYRLLLKATAADPDDRFQSAEEMGDQLFGVLREIVAAEDGTTVMAQSTLFTTDLRARPEAADWRLLPAPRVAGDDAASGYLASLTAADARGRLDLLGRAPVRTVEVELQTAAALIDTGEHDAALAALDAIAAGDPWEWRVDWYRGVAAVADGGPGEALDTFARVYDAVPGELAPKLAIGVAAELAGRHEQAAGWYEIVSRTDPWLTTATFGLARCAVALGDHARALRAYERVPDTSASYLHAQMARIRCLLVGGNGRGPDLPALRAADASLADLDVGAEDRARLTARLLESALHLLERDGAGVAADVRIAGHPMNPQAIRTGMERAYRSLARFATSTDERIELVDQANRVRPRTWT